MKNTEAARWFKTQFQSKVEAALTGSPFTVDLLTAIALQETGYLWRRMVDEGKLTVAEILERCVGDTIDHSGGRSAFPIDQADLLSRADGAKMFDIARNALKMVAPYDEAYAAAFKKPAKFCRGFGIFQYDLQFFKDDPAYFLNKDWADFDLCLGKAIYELHEAMKRAFGAAKTKLTDTEQVYVAIAYNKGSVNLSKGFKQGHESDGRYYGENIFEFLRISQSVTAGPGGASAEPKPGEAPLPQPTPIEVTGDLFRVDADPVLRLRSEPKIDKKNETGNIIARLPDGHVVHRLAGKKGDDFWEVETSLKGAHYRGFASSEYLKPVDKTVTEVPVEVPLPTPPAGGIPAVSMPRKSGTITKRRDRAGAHSLNEPGQPERRSETATERCNELAEIIAYLAVDNSAHLRYQPTSTATFCNIYAHDYCMLAGCYLPRVWWLPGAIKRIAQGEKVQPVYEQTIDEQRANDLFRWLRDFGGDFGWRATGTLTKLQDAANLGGIGIIVARRKDDGRSGHIVVVVPETEQKRARRNSNGEVIAPLQSQAGSVNFQYGTGKLNWWTDERFAASAFYIHA